MMKHGTSRQHGIVERQCPAYLNVAHVGGDNVEAVLRHQPL